LNKVLSSLWPFTGAAKIISCPKPLVDLRCKLYPWLLALPGSDLEVKYLDNSARSDSARLAGAPTSSSFPLLENRAYLSWLPLAPSFHQATQLCSNLSRLDSGRPHISILPKSPDSVCPGRLYLLSLPSIIPLGHHEQPASRFSRQVPSAVLAYFILPL